MSRADPCRRYLCPPTANASHHQRYDLQPGSRKTTERPGNGVCGSYLSSGHGIPGLRIAKESREVFVSYANVSLCM